MESQAVERLTFEAGPTASGGSQQIRMGLAPVQVSTKPTCSSVAALWAGCPWAIPEGREQA